MEVPEQLMKDLTSHMESAGIPVPDSEERWAMALNALKVLHCSSASPLLHTSLVLLCQDLRGMLKPILF